MSDQAPHHEQNPKHAPIGYEPFGTSVRGVVVGLFGVVALVVVTVFAMDLLLDFLAPVVKQPETLGRRPQAPELQSEPPVDQNQPEELRELRAQAEELLSSYAWVDEQKGIARIPIERAMRIFATQHAEAAGTSANSSADDSPATGTNSGAAPTRPSQDDDETAPIDAPSDDAPADDAPDSRETPTSEGTP